MVPEVEEREAAIFAGYNWREWSSLDYRERVDGVAHLRLQRLIDLNRGDAEVAAAEAARKREELKARG